MLDLHVAVSEVDVFAEFVRDSDIILLQVADQLTELMTLITRPSVFVFREAVIRYIDIEPLETGCAVVYGK